MPEPAITTERTWISASCHDCGWTRDPVEVRSDRQRARLLREARTHSDSSGSPVTVSVSTQRTYNSQNRGL
jgi:hypothetical protein